MQFSLRGNLPFITITLGYQQQTAVIDNVLVDTGSASTILATEAVARVQIVPMPNDELHIIRGVGGREAVFSRVVDSIQVGQYKSSKFEIEVGGMDYGFQINGILGMDFLTQSGALIDLQSMRLTFASQSP